MLARLPCTSPCFSFMYLVSKLRLHFFAESSLFQVLQNFDKQGNGSMPSAEIKRVLTSIGDKLSEEEAQQIVEGFENSYGNVKYEGNLNMKES